MEDHESSVRQNMVNALRGFRAILDEESGIESFRRLLARLHPQLKLGRLRALEAAWSRDFQAKLADARTAGGHSPLTFESLVAAVAQRAQAFGVLFPKGLPYMHQNRSRSVTLSREQVACVLCCMFLGIDPNRTGPGDSIAKEFPFASFLHMFQLDRRSTIAKLQCFLVYFASLQGELASGEITFQRIATKPLSAQDWRSSGVKLGALKCEAGSIDDAEGCLRVDFANQFLGGGVLGGGNVQEEIMFSVRPELTAALAFTPRMLPHEAVAITGAQQFSQVSGYGGALEFATCCTLQHRSKSAACSVVAIDALPFPKGVLAAQLQENAIQRELIKAFAGFSAGGECAADKLPAVATGNWGCGLFNGYLPLKAVVQWLAASQAQRNVVYFPFNCHQFGADLSSFSAAIVKRGVTVGQLYSALLRYAASGAVPGSHAEFFQSLLQSVRS